MSRKAKSRTAAPAGAAAATAGAPETTIMPLALITTPPDSEERSLLAPYARFREKPLNAFQELGLHIVGEGWRKYDRVIGPKSFYPGFSENMKKMVMAQALLLRKIRQLAQKRVEVEVETGLLGGLDAADGAGAMRRAQRQREIEEQLRSVAEDWTGKMICKQESHPFIRAAYYGCSQLLTRAYHQGIHVSSDEVRRLREVAQAAASKKKSIVFLPCHRSHVDYVSLQLICYRLGLALPTVVAGDNLNFPVVGTFLQHAGAMWIRRSFGDDQLYTTLVQSYIDTLLQNGFNIECFVEGTRSRTGKLLQPKFGILGFILESILSGRVEDAIICPVSTQYDKVIEVDSYVRELLGTPKPKEDLASFLSASNVLSLRLGRVDVRFHEPWSLREFIDDHRQRLAQKPSDDAVVNEATLRRRMLTTLGYKVLSDINEVSVVMPTALVGTVLLTLRGRGVGRSELVRRVDWLCERVRGQGGRVSHFAGNSTEVVVDRALEVLGPKLVGRIQGLAEETFYAEDRFQLSFYRNMTIHLFVSQAIVCVALYTRVKFGGDARGQRMTYKELEDYVYFLSRLFRSEFIFPTTSLEENLNDTLHGLEVDKVITCTRIDNGQVETIEMHAEERACGRENFDFYCFCIWPFVEANWLGAISIFMLTPPLGLDGDNDAVWTELKTFQDYAQLLGKTLYHQGDLSYFEAVNKEALKNALGRQEEEGVIIVSREKDAKVPQRVRLHPDWIPQRDVQDRLQPRGKLWELCERIGQSRREGKNRRDGATVHTRVLSLADRMGSRLFEATAIQADNLASRPQRKDEAHVRAQL